MIRIMGTNPLVIPKCVGEFKETKEQQEITTKCFRSSKVEIIDYSNSHFRKYNLCKECGIKMFPDHKATIQNV